MLATFVIGLREGLEAALIIGIIAAFLKQSNRADALRKVWAGVAVAVAVCLAVGISLQLFSAGLPQREQEMLECVVAAVAVVMVSYMVLWMRAHSRGLHKDLQAATGSALASGSAGALVVMAFLAVIREGFETAVFLLAAFQSAISPAQAVLGVVLGVAVAVGLGYLVYRGGVQLNLSRFFRITGVVLVLVAAGLVMSTLRAAYEAGWLTLGQQTMLDLSAVARPGSVQESLLTGMLGIRSSLPVVEVVAYVLYAVPMLLVVLWPAKRTPSRAALGRLLVGTAAAALAAAGLLALLAPSAPGVDTARQGPFELRASAAAGGGTALVTVGSDARTATLELTSFPAGAPQTLTGTVQSDTVVLTGPAVTSEVDAAATGLPASLTATELAAQNGGRLPVGVRSTGAGDSFDVAYRDAVTPTVRVDGATGIVTAIDSRLVRTLLVTVPGRGVVQAGVVLDERVDATDAALAAGAQRLAAFDADRARHQVVGQVIPALLVLFAIVLLAFGLPKLPRRQPVSAAPGAASRAPSDPPQVDRVDQSLALSRPPSG
ncbi:iron uptake transporter permease EfeU [Nakamurella sp. GG22]